MKQTLMKIFLAMLKQLVNLGIEEQAIPRKKSKATRNTKTETQPTKTQTRTDPTLPTQ
jgi:hypothetical protein